MAVCRHPFATKPTWLPKKPIPLQVTFLGPAKTCIILFDEDIHLGVWVQSDWQLNEGGLLRIPQTHTVTGDRSLRMETIPGGPFAGDDAARYTKTSDFVLNDQDNAADSFFITTDENLPVLTLATFSLSTGDTVLTFDQPVDLVDGSKLPWNVRQGSKRQIVKTVGQSGAAEITLTTQVDGPDAVGDFVSYDSSPVTVRTMEGQAILAVLEFPLTLIP